MLCSQDHDNPDGQRFCGTCGEPLASPAVDAPTPTESTNAPTVVDRETTARGFTAELPQSYRWRIIFAAGVIVVALAVGVIVVVINSGSSSSSSTIAETNTTFDTTPLTPQQVCEQTLPNLWNQEAGNGMTYPQVIGDVMQKYGFESAIYHAFRDIVIVAEQKQYLVGAQAAAAAANADVSTACSDALQQYSIDPSQETTTSF